MPPKPQDLKLSEEALNAANNDKGSKQGNRDGRPQAVRLVIGGSGGIKAINEITLAFKDHGFGQGGAVKLAGLAYEMQPGEKADPSLDALRVAFETPGNVPVTLIHPLSGAISVDKIPPPDTPPQFAQICFSLPTIRSAADVQGDKEATWLSVLKAAGERSLTLELAVTDNEQVYEAVEKLLGKAWDQEVEAAKAAGEEDSVNTKGVRILFDGFAAPPLSQSSSQLPRSKENEAWSDFVSRLALHPRVFLKLSPLRIPSLLPPSVTAITRPADMAVGPITGSGIYGSVARTATDLTTQAAQATTYASASDRREELQRRLRIFIETALEAFGEERLMWTSYLSAGSATAASVTQRLSGSKDDLASLTEPEQWFESVLATLQAIGVSQEALDNIFSKNVSTVYRM